MWTAALWPVYDQNNGTVSSLENENLEIYKTSFSCTSTWGFQTAQTHRIGSHFISEYHKSTLWHLNFCHF